MSHGGHRILFERHLYFGIHATSTISQEIWFWIVKVNGPKMPTKHLKNKCHLLTFTQSMLPLGPLFEQLENIECYRVQPIMLYCQPD